MLRPSLCRLLITACFLMPALLAGCAAVDQKIVLDYSLTDNQQRGHSGDVAVARLNSGAPKRNADGAWLVGSINNVYGVHQADLLANRNPDEWITDAVIRELQQVGYRAQLTDRFPPAAGRGLAITAIRVALNENRGITTSDTSNDLSFDVEVYLNGAKIKTFTVASRDSRTLLFSASQEELEKIMLQSLQDAIRKVLPDIILLIDKS